MLPDKITAVQLTQFSKDYAPTVIEVEDSIFKKIESWARAKGIYAKGDPKTQTLKLLEETGELAKAILNNDQLEIIDAIGDCVVVLTSVAVLCGLNIEDCIQSAYDVIKNRKGEMKNGTFIKEQ